MNHYETLGVPKDADQATIRAAYRRLMSEHHPDREGGDADQAAAVNHAYHVLSDETLRLEYDGSGGMEGDEAKIELAARDLVCDFFKQVSALDSWPPDVIPIMRTTFAATLVKAHKEVERIETAQARLTKHRRRIVARGSMPNLAHQVIDKQLVDLEREAGRAKNGIDALNRAVQLVDEFADVGEPIQPSIRWTWPCSDPQPLVDIG